MMNPISEQQMLMDRAAFPIFATDKSGTIVYKNPAVRQFFPTLRRGVDLRRYLMENTESAEITCVHIRDNVGYRRALPVRFGEHILFFAFNRLQYPDYQGVAPKLHEYMLRHKETLLLLCRDFDASQRVNHTTLSRLLAEFPRFCSAEADIDKHTCHTGILFDALSQSLPKRFSAFGIRLGITRSLDFAPSSAIRTDLYELLSLISLIVYCTLRLSKSRSLDITLSSDARLKTHILSIVGDDLILPAGCDNPDAVFDVLSHIAPECIVELLLMRRTELLSESVRLITNGNRITEIRLTVPYTVPMHCVHNTTTHAEIDAILAMLCERIGVTLNCTSLFV
ncbi:MAG: hypothetical protein IJV98_00760 [Clostridia bacterium]|nr:hypothetical protein [Clostridia bacterium]